MTEIHVIQKWFVDKGFITNGELIAIDESYVFKCPHENDTVVAKKLYTKITY